MKWQKTISTILHPVVVPTIGAILFFMLVDLQLRKSQKLLIFATIFVATYIIPVLLLILLKSIKLINSYRVHSISERKIPLIIMTILFIILGKSFYHLAILRDFSTLFFGTALSLIVVYFLFKLELKSSLHLLSLGASCCFFILLGIEYDYNVYPIVTSILIASGFLAKARLDLKAHTHREVYLGFFLGFIGQIIMHYTL